jgi:cobalt-zinc-cadmium resistance protein CzcA
MARHKINADNINNMLEAAVAGKSASTLYENLWPVDIVVRLPESVREGKETLESLLIASPLGYSVPLSEVASIDLEEAPARITKHNRNWPRSNRTCPAAIACFGAVSLRICSVRCGV